MHFIRLGLCLGWKGQYICCVTKGREGEGRGGEGRGGEGRGGKGRGGEGGRRGMTVIHILMAPQYLNNNHVTYYVIT